MAQPIEPRKDAIAAAATPANTPLNVAPISRGEGLPKPSVATVEEDEDDDEDDLEGGNPASVLARVSPIPNSCHQEASGPAHKRYLYTYFRVFVRTLLC
jgi:hypothetical protein